MTSSAKASLAGISLLFGILVGVAGTLLLSSAAIAGKDAPPVRAAQPAAGMGGYYLPRQLEQQQREAAQQDLPPQFWSPGSARTSRRARQIFHGAPENPPPFTRRLRTFLQGAALASTCPARFVVVLPRTAQTRQQFPEPP